MVKRDARYVSLRTTPGIQGMGPISDDARDHALAGDFPDGIAVGDVQVAGGIEDQTVRILKLRGCGQAAVPLAAARAVAGDTNDPAVGADPPNPVVEGIGDI